MRVPAPPSEINAALYKGVSNNQRVVGRQFVDSNLHERMQDRRSRVRLRMRYSHLRMDSEKAEEEGREESEKWSSVLVGLEWKIRTPAMSFLLQ